MQIITYIYTLIGIIGGIYTIIEHIKKRRKENDNKQKYEDRLNYQITDINKTLKEHDHEDKEIKDSIKKIEQEQENQNIKIAQLHTKIDLICKASNVDINNKKDEEDRGSNDVYEKR